MRIPPISRSSHLVSTVPARKRSFIMTFARRLPHGKGYAFEAAEVTEPLSGAQGVRALNAAVEQMVARDPGQYLWAYNRFKVPAGAPPPESRGDAADAASQQ